MTTHREDRTSPATVVVDGVAHRVIGAQLAVVRDGRVLIQLRPWPPGWEMPGGHCRPDEDPAACAVRETEEETGYIVAATRLAGVYRWKGWRSGGDAVYVGEIVGGRPRRSIESLGTRFVDAGNLPRTIFPWMPQRIVDALAAHGGAAPVHRTQPVGLRHVLFFGVQWLAALLDWLRRFRHSRHEQRARR
jgi:8-oxo-dGTP pyrophosphatase MutT (NUDIX family)